MQDETKTLPLASDGNGPDPAPAAMTGQLAVPPKIPAPPPENSAPRKRLWWVWAGVAVFVLAAPALWYFQRWVSQGLAVTVETAATGSLTRVLAVNGRLAPQHLVDVKPTVRGELTSVLVEEGAVVTRGDILARIDASAEQTMVRQAMAGLDAALVAQSQAEASLARAEKLGENITRTALADARSRQQTAVQEVVRLAAVSDQAQIELAKFTIVAPKAGTVLARNAEVGQSVDITTTLFSLANLEPLVVETNVDEVYAAQIALGLPAVMQLKGDTAKLDGSVSFVAAQVDAATGGLAVEIAFDDPVAAPVGLTVTANIIVDRQDAAISVPRAAVAGDAAGAAVFVLVAGEALRREVTIVNWPADRVEVTQGLVAGDLVITDATGLTDGLAVVVPEP